MQVKYDGPHEAVEIAETGQIAARGGTVEVSDDLGRRLCEQATWSKVMASKRKKAPAATTSKEEE